MQFVMRSRGRFGARAFGERLAASAGRTCYVYVCPAHPEIGERILSINYIVESGEPCCPTCGQPLAVSRRHR